MVIINAVLLDPLINIDDLFISRLVQVGSHHRKDLGEPRSVLAKVRERERYFGDALVWLAERKLFPGLEVGHVTTQVRDVSLA